MRKIKNTLFYVLTIGGFSYLIYWIATQGAKLENPAEIITPVSDKSHWMEFVGNLQHNVGNSLAILLAQIVIIMITVRLFGWICRKIGQPAVIGEIIAGVALGPSLLGMYFPSFSEFLFPTHSLGNLHIISQIGLILFMFIVGMEIDTKVLKNKAHEAILISHAGIIVPFTLGIGLAYFLYQSYVPAGVKFSSFGLFMGIAMSIAAFPVLARIIQERGIHKTRLGTVILTCAAVDDITAWSLLAVIIAIVKAGSFVSAIYVILMVLIYVFLMIKVVRPFLKRIGDLHSTKESLTKSIIGIFFLVLIISAWTTEIIGIHALFGAFMAGAIMPTSEKFRSIFIEKIEDVSLILLLPLFFVFTGLRTEIGLINDPELWKVTGLIILVATVGKISGITLSAKFVRQSWKDSLTMGALMNTRGLMELIVLNIGYDLGVLTPQVFAMMVVMALFTTFLTGPLLNLINIIFKSKADDADKSVNAFDKYNILISFGKPESGRSLLRLANFFTKKISKSTVTTMHLFSSSKSHHYNVENYENKCFEPIIDESEKLDQKITTLFKVTNSVESDIIDVANKGGYDLLLIGIGQSIFEGSLLGKVLGFTTRIINPDRIINQVTGRENIFENSPFDERTRSIIAKSKIPVGILIDKELENTDKICIAITCKDDLSFIKYTEKLINYSDTNVTFLDVKDVIKKNQPIKEHINKNIDKVKILNKDDIKATEFFSLQDLLMVSSDSWKYIIENRSDWLQVIPSTFIFVENTY